MANSVDPDQTAPLGAVCSGSTLFASILYLSVMLGSFSWRFKGLIRNANKNQLFKICAQFHIIFSSICM